MFRHESRYKGTYVNYPQLPENKYICTCEKESKLGTMLVTGKSDTVHYRCSLCYLHFSNCRIVFKNSLKESVTINSSFMGEKKCKD